MTQGGSQSKQTKPFTVAARDVARRSAHHVWHIMQLVTGLRQCRLIELGLRVGAHLAAKPAKENAESHHLVIISSVALSTEGEREGGREREGERGRERAEVEAEGGVDAR